MIEVLLKNLRFRVHEGLEFYQAIYLGEAQQAEGVRLAILKTNIVFRPNVIISMGKMNGQDRQELDRFVEDQLAILRRAPNFRLLKKKDFTGSRPTVLIRQAMRNAEGVGVEQLQLYVALGEGKVLIVTATHLPAEAFEKYEEAFLEMMQSLETADGSRLAEGLRMAS